MDNIVPQDTPDNNIPLKRCPKCPEDNQWHPATTEFFHRNNQAKDGLQTYCKECRKAQQENFLSRPEVQARRKAYYARPDVKEHHSTYNKTYYANHPEMKEKMKEYRNRPDVHEKLKEKKRTYYSLPEVQHRVQIYHNNPRIRERYRTYNKIYYHSHRINIQARARHRQRIRSSTPEIREQDRSRRKTYYSQPETQAQRKIYYSQPETRARYKAHKHNRRARNKAVQGTHTPEQIREQYDRQKQKCYYCRKKVKWGEHHIDHTFPLSRTAGTDIPANSIDYLVITCPHCNLSKNDKFPWEWPEGGRLL